MLEQYTTLVLFHFILIVCRVGSMLMVMPGFGEIYVSPSVRLALALTMSLALAPVLNTHLPPVPLDIFPVAVLVLQEILIGLFFGTTMRMLQSALHSAGMMIAFQSSLASALLFDINQGNQGSVVGNFLTMTGVTLLFVTDLHHLMLTGIAESYQLFSPSQFPNTSEFAQFAGETLSASFEVAFKIASPLIVIGTLLYLAAGMMARLMPSMQVFFVLIPIQLYISFFVLMLTLSSGLMLYLNYIEDKIEGIFQQDVSP